MVKSNNIKFIPVVLLMLAVTVSAAWNIEAYPEKFSIRVTNPLKSQRTDVMIFISADQIQKTKSDFNPKAFAVFDHGKEIASQYNFKEEDHKGIVVVLDSLKSNESRVLEIKYNKDGETIHNYKKRTQAELSQKVNGEWKGREYVGGNFKNVEYLRVPKEQKDHSWFLRYEGPGWESDKVGYRFYLDQRNATDIFGKKVAEPVLQNIGLDGFDSYHQMQPWGMDVMKTGKALGVGSIGAWVNEAAIRVELTDSVTSSIDENGNVYSSILTKYYGWKAGNEVLNVDARLSIHAGTRLTDCSMTLNKDSEILCTGVNKDEKTKVFQSQGDAKSWGYVATYGQQSLNKDNLGVAVLFKPSSFSGFASDKLSNVVKLKSKDKKLEYYFLGAWEGEPNGIKNEGEFLVYLKAVANELANPVTVKIIKSK